VAIYRAHKATPIVIASEGEERFGAALQALTVPAVHPQLAFVLCTVVGATPQPVEELRGRQPERRAQ